MLLLYGLPLRSSPRDLNFPGNALSVFAYPRHSQQCLSDVSAKEDPEKFDLESSKHRYYVVDADR